MKNTQRPSSIGAPSRTLSRRLRFLRRRSAEPLRTFEHEALDAGWLAMPAGVTFAEARKQFTGLAGKNRPLGNKDLFAIGLLNHCARIYSLEDTHQLTIQTITAILDDGAGEPVLTVLRRAVRDSSVTALGELVQSKSWIASVTDRVTTASRPRPATRNTPHLWQLRNAPTYTFAGIYTALLGALGYPAEPRSMTLLAWDIASIAEGLGIAELSRNRAPAIRPRTVQLRNVEHARRATDPREQRWPLLGFVIMKLLEPHLAAISPNTPTVSPTASSRFLSLIREHDSFHHD